MKFFLMGLFIGILLVCTGYAVKLDNFGMAITGLLGLASNAVYVMYEGEIK